MKTRAQSDTEGFQTQKVSGCSGGAARDVARRNQRPPPISGAVPGGVGEVFHRPIECDRVVVMVMAKVMLMLRVRVMVMVII